MGHYKTYTDEEAAQYLTERRDPFTGDAPVFLRLQTEWKDEYKLIPSLLDWLVGLGRRASRAHAVEMPMEKVYQHFWEILLEVPNGPIHLKNCVERLRKRDEIDARLHVSVA